MTRTYTPGYSGIKAFLVICGLLLFGLGLLQIHGPLVAAFHGIRTPAIVMRIERSNGQGVKNVYTTNQAIPADDTRTDVFHYWLEIEMPNGRPRQAKLAAAHQVRPVYLVGDSVVICYSEQTPDIIYGLYDWSTWILGFILMFCGVIFSGAFLHLFIMARRPTPIPDDTPENIPL